ncbi:MAG: hypothetical protein HRU35_06535 [Rickettsiaceae bacterium]|nr:hypothetical protein [Rickettsiaceae bacterium]
MKKSRTVKIIKSENDLILEQLSKVNKQTIKFLLLSLVISFVMVTNLYKITLFESQNIAKMKFTNKVMLTKIMN